MQNYVSGTTCPVSLEKVSESVVRLNAFFAVFIAILALAMENVPLFVFLGIDFAFRAFSLSKLSLIRAVSEYLVQTLRLHKNTIDAAPKRFAAGVGLLFCASIGTALSLEWYQTADILGGILLFCACLEAVVGYCVGCQVYAWFVFPFLKK